MAAIQIRSEIDLDAPGKQVGYLRVPHSSHRSAYGWIPVPIASIRNGNGPTILVMAGNHGDEYEGQVLVSRLIREVEPDMVAGQLILLTMANFPAAEAGLRTSPIDAGNLNRSFPGDPAGTPTQVIAHFIESTLLSRADIVIDLHSGGSSLLYDGANMLALEPRDAEERSLVLDLLDGFGLQRAVLHAPNPVTISSAARRQGAISIVTELGGGGMIDPRILCPAEEGLRHCLGHARVLQGRLVPERPPGKPRLMRIDAASHYVYARDGGLFEPLVELGDEVKTGRPAARIHFPETPTRDPVTVSFEGDGVVVCKRALARTRIGDCLFHLAADDGR
jgi:predicted deacylase